MKFPTDRPVKVVMLGAGGTGGYVAIRRGSSAIRLFIRARNSSTSTAATESIPDRSCAACEETEERSANLLAAFIPKC